MKIKVSESEGAKLNYWVARALGFLDVFIDGDDVLSPDPEDGLAFDVHKYSTDWSQGGPIIEREKITIEPNPYGLEEWAACIGLNGKEPFWVWKNGKTALIAAMRAFVASKFREEVEE